MDKNYYQMVRIKNRETGQPTTLSIDHMLYIEACRYLRCTDAVNKLIGKLALECTPGKGKTLSATAGAALAEHLRVLKSQR
jgi:hypothetical protein